MLYRLGIAFKSIIPTVVAVALTGLIFGVFFPSLERYAPIGLLVLWVGTIELAKWRDRYGWRL